MLVTPRAFVGEHDYSRILVLDLVFNFVLYFMSLISFDSCLGIKATQGYVKEAGVSFLVIYKCLNEILMKYGFAQLVKEKMSKPF